MLTITGLTKSFGSGSNKLQVLKGVEMEIERGEMVALMGPSGCGKVHIAQYHWWSVSW